MVFGDIDREHMAEWEVQKLKQTHSTADYTVHFTRFSVATNWDNVALTAIYYAGLKDNMKDEIARGEQSDNLRAMTVMAIRIDNCLYKQRKEKGQSSYSNSKKTVTYMSGQQHKNQRQKNNKYGLRQMEIDAIELKKKKIFEGDCYNCRKKGHLAKDCQGPAQMKRSEKSKGINHESLSWIGCYDNGCPMHRSKEEGSGCYPQ